MIGRTTTLERSIVLVDMDGVLANFEKGCLDKWREQYPDLSYVKMEERTTHDIKAQYDLLGPGYGVKMRDIIHSKGFYESLEPICGAINSMEGMMEEGWDVFICTTPARNSHCLSEKAAWIEKYLGSKWVERLITTRDKTLVYGDVLIDDKPVITGIREAQFTHILFDQPYNRKESSKMRLTWESWLFVLEPFFSGMKWGIEIQKK